MPTQSVLNAFWRCPAGPLRRWWSNSRIIRWLIRGGDEKKGAANMTTKPPVFNPDKAKEGFHYYWLLKLITLLYFVGVLALAGYALLAVRNETFFWHRLHIDATGHETEKQAMYAFLGGVIGAAAFAFHGFSVAAGPRVPDKPRFNYDPNWTIWYIASPLVGGFLALIAYAVVKAGVGGLGAASTDQQANIGFFAVGALAGFSTKRVMNWLDSRSGAQWTATTGGGEEDDTKPKTAETQSADTVQAK